ncbi:1-deoxy-D-xylulose-5-phosphate synthase [Desulfomicrobium apsheronum]|uniref:1-deoxy-D-xylulose-5-phosphate synthase n=1 Tax=Desulfomicrobium apsheronum TaxID=52560 RepID=A0A1I3URU4_9BACT|nr:1-deoxy-D-xylulose-5-phosphate synthase [Desulfomicrobium apsheronum]MDY0227611.1 1-deoxy-D-xylulose-5-phosphate synthase [Desulfomicrobium apsheronum]SFJ84517.1 1-deoxy-D-xylulose-5-phosphate synthase [Desulfomicrobium apsheronum]
MTEQTLQELFPTLFAIKSPGDVQTLDEKELTRLGEEIRRMIIQTVSATGGHLAPSLGVVELTMALLRVFNPTRDRIVWDVGHQAYAYKLLTGRLDRFHTLRQLDGISGFPRICESPYDHFGVGHSSTSISAALGMAAARDLAHQDHKVVAVIGDGSMTAGLAYEGLNQAGGLGKDLVVVLNDNEMSISRNVGALSSFLSRKLSKRWVQRFKKEAESIMRQIPKIGDDIAEYARRSEDSLKSFFTPGMLFEAFRFTYIGPLQGHDMRMLTNVFQQTRELEGPILVHVLTKKGKGYAPAETNPTFYHGVGCFEPETGAARKFDACSLPSYTEVFGSTLCKLAEKDERVVAITAAMPEGTGVSCFADTYPERFFDVGICEQHAVTFAAGFASQGMKPVVAIYSTFMQRSYDQIVHDVCLQNLNVTLCLDRSGLVGEDGATHHGVFDLSFLRHIPNLVVMAPRNEPELQHMLATALAFEGPVALRYPRGVGEGAPLVQTPMILPIGQGELLREGTDGVVVALGSRVNPALEAARMLCEETGKEVAVFNARFVKPLPEEQLLALAASQPFMLLVEENALPGGFGSAVLELLADHDALSNLRVRRLGVPDRFVEHGSQKELRVRLGINRDGILNALHTLAC